MMKHVCVEYVWLDANQEARSKTKCIPNKESIVLEDLSDWNFDVRPLHGHCKKANRPVVQGSSTGQAPGDDSEVMITPRALFSDPFRGAPHCIALCDCYTPLGVPIPTNTRALAAKVFAEQSGEVPWFGIEQEYVMFKDGTPLGWPQNNARHGQSGGPSVMLGYPGPQGPYYCSAGADVAFGRKIVEEHMMVCVQAGLQISGTNAEVMPGQWEFQVGPCVGLDAGDQHIMARYLLARVCEKYGVVVSYEPKPIVGFNGSGCHTNFSTLRMRETEGALEKYIIPAIEKLGKRHAAHIANYGAHNEQRLTGHHETASIDKFSWGVANRGASVRVGNDTAKKGLGYFEDRRPAANMDPYLVTGMIFDTVVLDAKFAAQWPKASAAVSTRRMSSLRSSVGKVVGDVRRSVGRSVSKEDRRSVPVTAIENTSDSSVDANSEEGGAAVPATAAAAATEGKKTSELGVHKRKKAGCAVIM